MTRNIVLLVVIYMAFVSLGLPDGVFGVAWPGMRADFDVPLESAGLISLLLMVTSAFSSFSNGWIVKRTGTGRLVFISCLMTGLALMGYSFIPSFSWLIFLALPLGFGQGAVDSSLNNYVASHYSSRHMSWLHCFWGVGATAGPLILSATLAHGKSWRGGYFSVSAIQLVLAALFFLSLGLWQESKRQESNHENAPPIRKSSLLNSLVPWMSILVFLIYAGAEFGIGLWGGSVLVESRNIAKEAAGVWISLYYGSLMGGRFLTGLVVNKLGNRTLIRIGLAISSVGAALIFFKSSHAAALAGLMMCGLGFAPIYPCMMHETPRRFDEEVSRSLIGYQVGAACIGGSVITAGLGVLFSKISLELFPASIFALIVAMIAASEVLNRKTLLRA